MEQANNRRLLYYDHFKREEKHYGGAPIVHFMYRDVRTGQYVTLGSCFFAEGASEALRGRYYNSILDATNDFDILWNVSDDVISPIDNSFEDVQSEYRRMVDEGVSPLEINSELIKLYSENKQYKKVKIS